MSTLGPDAGSFGHQGLQPLLQAVVDLSRENDDLKALIQQWLEAAKVDPDEGVADVSRGQLNLGLSS